MRSLGLILLMVMTLSSQAQTLEIPVGEQGDPQLTQLPQTGESRRSVLERFGLADQEHAPVGQPPITRWDYREFSVYFEYDHVVNSVRHHRPQYLKEQP